MTVPKCRVSKREKVLRKTFRRGSSGKSFGEEANRSEEIVQPRRHFLIPDRTQTANKRESAFPLSGPWVSEACVTSKVLISPAGQPSKLYALRLPESYVSQIQRYYDLEAAGQILGVVVEGAIWPVDGEGGSREGGGCIGCQRAGAVGEELEALRGGKGSNPSRRVKVNLGVVSSGESGLGRWVRI